MSRKEVPAHQNMVMLDPTSAVQIARGDLAMTVCTSCGFVFNSAFDLSRLNYGQAYDNNQAHSPSFNRYMDNLANYLITEQNTRNCRIVDVGCGNGGFLRRLVEAENAGNSGYGFDPAYHGPLEDLGGRLRFEKRYYGPECADIPADVVVCRHVIEHVPEPVGLLRAVRQALKNAPQARVFFETPCVEWILRNQVFWDFFYEHCSLFTVASLTTAFEAAGFAVAEVRHVFGGQYLWLEARVAAETPVVTRYAGEIPALAAQFALAESILIQQWSERLETLRAKGKVALWGAGAKGVTFANLIDPKRQKLDCIVDLNPNKQGRFLPGTGHPIVDYHELNSRNVKHAILMNPNYYLENEMLIHQAGIFVDLIE